MTNSKKTILDVWMNTSPELQYKAYCRTKTVYRDTTGSVRKITYRIESHDFEIQYFVKHYCNSLLPAVDIYPAKFYPDIIIKKHNHTDFSNGSFLFPRRGIYFV